MGYIANKSIVLLGGMIRWLFTSWMTKKKLKEYFEFSNGEEDKSQDRLNYYTGIGFLLIIIAVISIMTTNHDKPEFRKLILKEN